jgi:hypothetical protein
MESSEGPGGTEKDQENKLKLIKGEGKPKPREKQDQAPKIPPAVLYNAISDAINQRAYSGLPLFPVKFSLYAPARGRHMPALVSEDQVVTLIEDEAEVDKAIMAYCNRELANNPHYRFTARTVKEAREFWMMATPAIESEVKPARWLSEQGYTFNRLPWDPSTAPTPTWDQLLGRLSNVAAFRQWIGSLFFDQADLQQYVWLQGFGGDGKGAISRFLARVFGNSYASKEPPGKDDRFWTHGLIGKRLVIFPDCNNTTFVTSGRFKSMTGGDPISVEPKNRMPFTYFPRCKYLFFSNERPRLSSERADIRRIIYCEMQAAPQVDPSFEEKLWEEGGAFLGRAMAEYLEHNPQHLAIRIADDCKGALEAWVSVVEEQFEVIYEKHLSRPAPPFDTTEGLSGLDQEAAYQVCVSPHRMQAILSYYFKGNLQKAGEFVKWLEMRHGAKKKNLWLRSGHRAWGYVGVAEKAGFDAYTMNR